MMMMLIRLACFILLLNSFNIAGSPDKKKISDNDNTSSLSDTTSVEIKSFSADLNKNTVRLKWETTQGKDNKGFEVERKEEFGDFEPIVFLPPKTNQNSSRKYLFTDRIPHPGNYIYRIKIIDLAGEYKYSEEVAVDILTPGRYELGQNFPNPFNPSTLITFSLAVPSKVKLTIYNVLGQEIALLIDQDLSDGVHEMTFNSEQISSGLMSGVYLYKLEAKGTDGSVFTSTKKMIFTK